MNAEARVQLLSQLRIDEGFRAHPYRDTVGKLTIGYGRNLDDRGISRPEAETLLNNDVDQALAELRGAFWWFGQLDGVRAAVLVNMAVNLGLPRLRTFRKALAAIEAKDWPRAQLEMLDSAWARQVGPRADRLARQMLTGRWV